MAAETQYVLLIHGTWTNAPGWHSSNASTVNFCSVLKEELNLHGLADAVWRNGNDGSAEFNWSGSNKHEDRIEAGDLLGSRLRRIVHQDPTARINIVGHSHGCNVALRAIQDYLRGIQNEVESVVLRVFRSSGQVADIDRAIARILETQPPVAREQIKEMLEDLKAKLVNFRFSRPEEDFPLALQFLRSEVGVNFTKTWTERRNRLGRVVFLGPPFLRKVWAPRRIFTRVLVSVVDFLCAFFLTLGGFYAFCLILWGTLWLLAAPFLWIFGFQLLRSPALFPLEWSIWLLVPSGLISVIAGGAIGAAAASTSRRTNTNLYFDGDSLRSNTFGNKFTLATPIETMTVTAELLDEVLLGFSSEPIVYGALLPQIREFFNPKISFKLPPTPLGYERGLSEQLWRLVIFTFGIVSAFGWLMMRPITTLWERVWIRRLMQLISASAYGVQLHELDRALIVASSRLNQPRFFTERIWDVTKLIVSANIAPDKDNMRAEKYSFLWEGSQFEKKRNSSWIWRSIEPHRREIEEHYSRFPQSEPMESEDRLARACIMLEGRFSEAIGAVGLMHTAYHSNRVVVRAVSRFLVSGEIPS